MSKKAKLRVCNFTEYLNSLYEDVESYIDGTPLQGKKQQIELCQQKAGKYTVDKFTLFDENNKRVVEFLPAAALVFRGGGMVYLNGRRCRETLIYRETSNQFPKYVEAYSPNKAIKSRSKPEEKIFRPGWYWLDKDLKGTDELVNANFFIELMKMASGYEFE